MGKKRYLVTLWHKCKNVALLPVDNLDVLRTIRSIYKHDKVEVVDMETFEEKKPEKKESEPKSRKRTMRPWAMKIRCVETGEQWSSIAECQRQTGISFFSLNSACKTGKPVGGQHFEYVRDGDE